jgi:prolyl oligopeptidase
VSNDAAPRVLQGLGQDLKLNDCVVDTYYGIEVADEFRWLEDHRADRTRGWISEQSTISRSYLDGLSGRSTLFPQIEAALDHESIVDICLSADAIFYTKRRAGEEQAKLYRRSGLEGADQMVLDPTLIGEGSVVSLSILGASANGKNIALGLRTGGEGVRRLQILDVGSRAKLAELPKGAVRGFGFLPNDKGFMYSLDPIEDRGHTKTDRPRTTKIHYFDQPEGSDFLVFGTEAAQNVRLVSALQQDDSTVVHTVIRSILGQNTYSYYLQDLGNSAFPIRTLKENDSEQWEVLAHKGSLYIFTSKFNGPERSLLRVPLTNPDLSLARMILAEGKERIQSWHIFGNFLLTATVQNFSSALNLFSLEGQAFGRIEMPEPGTARIVAGDSEGIFYSFECYTSPQTVYYYSFLERHSKQFSASPLAMSGSTRQSITSRIVDYPAADLTPIPLTLLGRPEVLDRGNAPILLTAYGASGVILTPHYSCLALTFIQLGGVFAIAHVRGGGEKGIAWAEAGRRHNRPTVHRDFIAAAEYIASSGIGNKDRIAIAGGSNSGLLVTTAMTQRPDLFCTVLCLAPFTDMLRYHLFDNTQFYVPNFGFSEDRDDFPILLGYSPYHNVNDGVAYPPLLMISGDADTRCDPMHARKFVARVQKAMSLLPRHVREKNPILLEWDPLRGHVAALPLASRVRALVDRLAFLCHHLGMEIA